MNDAKQPTPRTRLVPTAMRELVPVLKLWLWWVVACAGGAAAGSASLPQPGLTPLWFIGGHSYFVGQWVVLRRLIPRASMWLLVSPTAVLLGDLVAVFVFVLAGFTVMGFPSSQELERIAEQRALFGASVGCVVGLLQGVLLRPRLWGYLGWVAASILGGIALVFGGDVDTLADHFPQGAGNGLKAGVAYGVVTGAALVWLAWEGRGRAREGGQAERGSAPEDQGSSAPPT